MNRWLQRYSLRLGIVALGAVTRARRVPGVGVLEQVLNAYREDHCSMLAAALSYYAMLSLFPLILFILALTSPFLQSGPAVREVSEFIGEYLPASVPMVRSTLDEVTRLRGPLTFVGVLGFLWSASGVFNLLQLGINRAFSVARSRPIWRERIISLAMIAAVALLFVLSFLMTTSLRLAIHYRLIPRHYVLVDALPPVLGVLLGIAIFGSLYRYVPFDPGVRWRDVWRSALVVSVLWEIAKLAFAWYLTNMALLNLVYGSVGAVIALMLWGYITATLLLAGGELAAITAGARARARTGEEWWARPEAMSFPRDRVHPLSFRPTDDRNVDSTRTELETEPDADSSPDPRSGGLRLR